MTTRRTVPTTLFLAVFCILLTGCSDSSAPPPGKGGVGATAPPSGAVVPASTPAPDQPPAACDCPVIKPVATSKEPARGRVEYELGEDDLEALFSNRVLRFGGSWDTAFKALSSDVDPQGTLKLGGARPAASYPDVKIVEGGLSDHLIRGTRPRPAPGNAWRSTIEPAIVTRALVNTVARTNKYGEPSFLLRKNALRSARYVTDDLAGVPTEAAAAGGRALEIAGFAGAARGVVWRSIEAVHPRALEIRRTRFKGTGDPMAVPSAKPDTLGLDVFDVANAALDVVWTVDSAGAEGGLLTARLNDAEQAASALLGVASGWAVFGGTAPRGSAHEAVACKAFSALVRLAGSRFPGSEAVRTELRLLFLAHLIEAGQPKARAAELAAARSALVLAGVGSAEEADRLVGDVVGSAINAADRQAGPWLDTAVLTLRSLEANAGGPAGNTHRKTLGYRIAERVKELEGRRTASIAGNGEIRFLERWKLPDVQRTPGPVAGAPCEPETCSEDIASEAPLIKELVFRDEPSLVAYSAARRGPDRRLITDITVDSVTREEPFFVQLRLSAERARNLGPAVSVTLTSEAGASRALTLDKRERQGPAVLYTNAKAAPIGLKTINRDLVTVSYGTARTAFEVFDTERRQVIARQERSLRAVKVFFESALDNFRGRPETAAAAVTIERKLAALGNARRILRYTPKPADRFQYSELTQLMVGAHYLAFMNTDPGNWDGAPGACVNGFRGADARFPGVVYDSCEESRGVNLAIDDAKAEMSEIALRNLAAISIGFYRVYVATSCFELQLAGAPFCPADYWTMVEGVDETGRPVSATEKLLTGAGIAMPFVLRGLGGLKEFATSQFEREAALAAREAAAVTRGEVTLVRRSSQLVRGTESIVAAEGRAGAVDLAKVRLAVNTERAFEGAVLHIPPGFTAKTGRQGQVLSPGGFLLQVSDDTCLLTTAEWSRRKAGLPAREEATNVILSYERGRYLKGGGIYTPGEGTYPDGIAVFLEREGARVATPSAINVNDIARQRVAGNHVLANINVAQLGEKPAYHSVWIEEIVYGPSGTRVVFGDPWNGNFWTTDVCTFRQRLSKEGSVIIDWTGVKR